MKVLMINVVCGIRSTGRICAELAEQMIADGHEVKVAYGREEIPARCEEYAIKIGSKWEQRLHGLKTRLLDEHGFGSKIATKRFLAWADMYNPDMLWLHNIHGYYLNVEMLFTWIKSRPHMKVKWTLHDCWSFTGHCTHFTRVGCEQWKTHCTRCVQCREYPSSMWRDNCKTNFDRKKQAFVGVNDMTIITPSRWLADLVEESYLREYPVEVCYNKIETSVFHATGSDFREKHMLENKKIVLGVASTWNEQKGVYDFIRLAKCLPSTYAVVLVGLTYAQLEKFAAECNVFNVEDVYQKKERINTPYGVAVPIGVQYILQEIIVSDEREFSTGAEIVCISRTNSQKELAEIYTAADYFVNPTYQDTFPTVNLEAKACGTYVITYNVGGCLETIQ